MHIKFKLGRRTKEKKMWISYYKDSTPLNVIIPIFMSNRVLSFTTPNEFIAINSPQQDNYSTQQQTANRKFFAIRTSSGIPINKIFV